MIRTLLESTLDAIPMWAVGMTIATAFDRLTLKRNWRGWQMEYSTLQLEDD